MSLDILEAAVNEITDQDHSWWPFLWLRPDRKAELSLGLVLSLSVLYGLPCSLLMGVAMSLLGRPPAELFVTAFAFPLLCLFSGSVVIAPMWNRRASRLRVRSRHD